jgi:hypothetical protein
MMIACYYFGQKYYPIPYKILADSLYIISTIVVIYLVSEIKIENLYISVGLHAVVILSFLSLVYLIERKEAFKSEAA